MKDTLILEAKKFTNTSALGKEIVALLESSDYKLEVHIEGKALESLAEEYESLRGLGRLKFKTLESKRGERQKASQHWEIVDDSYKKYQDGRLVALDTRKGREWYRDQVAIMAGRQGYICGLVEHGRCLHPDLSMRGGESAGDLRPTFEHADKRGAGGSRRNDNINARGNCAIHYFCNGALGSERI